MLPLPQASPAWVPLLLVSLSLGSCCFWFAFFWFVFGDKAHNPTSPQGQKVPNKQANKLEKSLDVMSQEKKVLKLGRPSYQSAFANSVNPLLLAQLVSS